MTKRIIIEGNVKDLAFIYRWAQNLVDDWVSIRGFHAIHNDISYLVQLLGGDLMKRSVVQGLNDINEVDFDGTQLYIEVATNDNLQNLKSWLEKRFPQCSILIQ